MASAMAELLTTNHNNNRANTSKINNNNSCNSPRPQYLDSPSLSSRHLLLTRSIEEGGLGEELTQMPFQYYLLLNNLNTLYEDRLYCTHEEEVASISEEVMVDGDANIDDKEMVDGDANIDDEEMVDANIDDEEMVDANIDNEDEEMVDANIDDEEIVEHET
ncbi:hypothetical protein Sjap_022054 [Stephania japonica]|uniref:Uncharacterized protein n=1 Tax=Stephania japonica TaxID=461633 RepID=A0AAP0ETH4_9MAGN